MTLAEKYDELAAGIDPRKQFVAIHRGRTNSDGAPVEPQRIDPETGLPLLDVFLRKNMADVIQFGWEEFQPPQEPANVKKTSSSRRSKTAK